MTADGRSIGQPATARGQKTRQRLLEAAETVFGEEGFDRASITAITGMAGVAQGTFYLYFPDKKAVFVELVRELSSGLRRATAAAVEGLTDRMEIEERGFRAFFEFAYSHRNLYRIVRQAEFVDEEVFRWYYRRLAEGYVAGIEQAISAGEVRPLDAECIAYCFMGAADFLGMRWVLWNDRLPPEEVIQSMVAFMRHGIDARPAPEAAGGE